MSTPIPPRTPESVYSPSMQSVKPKKRMGRPPKANARKALRLTVRLSQAEKERLDALRGDTEPVEYVRQKALA
jgi:hypothetical protein